MKKRLNFMVLILSMFLALQLNFTAFAEEEAMAQYVDKANHFTIPYPKDWIKKLNDPDYKVQFVNKEETVNLGVMVQPLDTKTSAKTFLSLMEDSMKVSNEFEEKDRIVTASDLKIFGADDGYGGRYTIVTDSVKVNQSIIVLMKGKTAYIVVQTIWDEQPEYDKYTGLLNEMFSYFKIK
jgi:hypothetical protein